MVVYAWSHCSMLCCVQLMSLGSPLFSEGRQKGVNPRKRGSEEERLEEGEGGETAVGDVIYEEEFFKKEG